MTTLTHRAERALLGAVIRDPDLIAELGYIEPGDFELNRHRELYTAIRETPGSGDPALPWPQAIVSRAGKDVTLDYLDELVAACPDPVHGRSYAALVLEAAFQRTISEAAWDAAAIHQTLSYDTARLAEAGSPAESTGTRLTGDVGFAAEAIRVHAARFDPGATYAPAGPAAPARGQRAHDEELILRAVVAGHEVTPRVLDLVRPAAFTNPLRRDVYAAVRAANAAGHSLDPVTVDWELGRIQARRGDDVPEAEGNEPSYATRLAGTSVAGEKVLQAARDLARHQPLRSPEPAPAPAQANAPALLQPPPPAQVDGQAPGPRR